MVLGIDPGLASTGWAVVDNKKSLVAYGCIETDKKEDFSSRLAKIHNQVRDLCRQYHIEVMAVESIFFAKNVKTAITVAQSLGAIKVAARNLKVAVFEYTPLQIKIAITGYGRATKEQVMIMVAGNFKDEQIITNNHAADAAAAALTHIFTMRI